MSSIKTTGAAEDKVYMRALKGAALFAAPYLSVYIGLLSIEEIHEKIFKSASGGKIF